MLEISHLTLTYPGGHSPALRDVSLALDREKMVVVGANGSGKSTLLKAALGLVPVPRGTVHLRDRDVNDITGDLGITTNLGEVYRLMYVPVGDLIRVYAELKGGDPREIEGRFHDFELEETLRHRMHELSTGQQKMVGNLLAMSFQPELVLLDEPFDNVDFTRRRQYVELLQSHDGPLLLNTHEFELLRHFSDWDLGFMFEGQLLGRFRVADLDRLYVSRGEAPGALAVLHTRLGAFSITRDHGDVPLKGATSLNAVMEGIA